MSDLELRQRLREVRDRRLGIEAYRAAVVANDGRTPPELALLGRAVGALAEAIKAWVASSSEGRGAGEAKYIDSFDKPETVAYVTVRAALDAIASHDEERDDRVDALEQEVIRSIIDAVEVEHSYEEMRKASPSAYAELARIRNQDARTRRVLSRLGKPQEIVWDEAIRLRIGGRLLALLVDTRTLVETATGRVGRNNSYRVVRLLPEVAAWLESAHAAHECMRPKKSPMVVPPVPWGRERGGYLSEELRAPAVVRGRIDDVGVLGIAARPEFFSVFGYPTAPWLTALNALQTTPWCINTSVLECMSRDFVSRDDLKSVERCKLRRQIAAARECANYEALYFPWRPDYRGRLYPEAADLSPQDDDAARGLLQFAEGKPLGREGAFWLAVQAANCYGNGMDRRTFEERLAWVESQSDLLNLMGEAKYRWQYLAAALEWEALRQHRASGSPVGTFISHLPVSMDGTCNGLQHYAALTRNPAEGELVGLLPTDKPVDIYQVVADQVNASLHERARQGEKAAARWAGRVDRDLTKYPVMTTTYGVTDRGIGDQVLKWHDKRLNELPEDFKRDKYRDCRYLADRIIEAMQSHLPAARTLMEQLREAGKVGRPVKWTTPSGFRVTVDEREPIVRPVTFHVNGERHRLHFAIGRSEKLDVARMRRAMPPAVIHSLDAAHLALTVCAAKGLGVTAFAMVHDSYGTHACDVSKMRDALRAKFIEMYEGGRVETMLEQCGVTVARGTLDLREVMRSSYFFA